MSTTPNRQRLFIASCMALIVTAMSFAIRAGMMGTWEVEFGLEKSQVGWIAGTAFWGFTLAMIIGGPLCDVLGMKRLVWLACICHLLSLLMTIFANGFWTLYIGTLLIGIGNGFVEAACNPLIATIYPDDKAKKLNQFHVWFPGGIVIGALAAFGLGEIGMGWRWQIALMIPPLIAYAFLFLGQSFPKTERVASGVPASQMFKECVRPFFIIMVLCMFLTAATELGTNQWIENILKHSAGVHGLLVLAWISGLMAIGRQGAGPVIHRLSPSGVLFASAVLATIGLFLLSKASGGAQAFGAAAVFAMGICYFWPTMLGFVAERFPKTGAMGLSTMGGAGMLAVSFVLPWMGGVYDENINQRIPEQYVEPVFADAPAEPTPKQLKELWKQARSPLAEADTGTPEADLWAEVQSEGGGATLGRVVVLPAVLIVVFGVIFARDKMSGGYKAEKLGGGDKPEDRPLPEEEPMQA